jgi:hypothetical protein
MWQRLAEDVQCEESMEIMEIFGETTGMRRIREI